MRQIQDKRLAELLMQLKYTPQQKRYQQLEALDDLVAAIDPEKEYPFEFVHFRITGFHLKRAIEPDGISGRQLLEDLRVFISKLSTHAAPETASLPEAVLTIGALAKDLGVSTKTIDRWRKRGLVARKFVFPDGVKRLGVLQSSMDHFRAAHPTCVCQAGEFRRLSNRQIEEIVLRARAYAAENLSRHQVIGRIAEETGRARETLRYTLINYEAAHPEDAIFDRPAGVVTPSQAARIYEVFRAGKPVEELMKQFDRSRSSIYRIINQRRAAALFARKIRLVPSEEFQDEQTCRAILAEGMDPDTKRTRHGLDSYEMMGEQLLPEYLQVLKEAPVLNGETELKLFRRYNCLKWLALKNRSKIKMTQVSSRLLSESEAFLAEAQGIERRIVEANLRLVVGIASHHAASGAGFAELVSKGNYALIKAVQEYNYTVGFRFGKRASLSIAKEYARVSGKSRELSPTKAASIGTIQRHLRETIDIAAIERARHSLTHVIRNELDAREQHIILYHFGLVGSDVKKQTKTLKQIGEDLDLSKERVRQIELVALQKLRQCLSSKEFELLTH